MAGAKVDCLIYLSTVLAVHPQQNKYQFTLDKLMGRGWLTPDVVANTFRSTRYLIVFEMQNDDNGIFRVEEGPGVERYFAQGSVITLDMDAAPVKPGEAATVKTELEKSTKEDVTLASKTGADVECKTPSTRMVHTYESAPVALAPCGGGLDTTIEMFSPG